MLLGMMSSLCVIIALWYFFLNYSCGISAPLLLGINIIFTSLYLLEAAVKLCVLRLLYFRSRWNVFDSVILIASIAGKSWKNCYRFFKYSVNLILLSSIKLCEKKSEIQRAVKFFRWKCRLRMDRITNQIQISSLGQVVVITIDQDKIF